MESEIRRAVTKTILLLIALLGVGSVALGVFLDGGSASETLLGALIVAALIIVLIIYFLSDREQQ
jgi:hypothetical protein